MDESKFVSMKTSTILKTAGMIGQTINENNTSSKETNSEDIILNSLNVDRLAK